MIYLGFLTHRNRMGKTEAQAAIAHAHHCLAELERSFNINRGMSTPLAQQQWQQHPGNLQSQIGGIGGTNIQTDF